MCCHSVLTHILCAAYSGIGTPCSIQFVWFITIGNSFQQLLIVFHLDMRYIWNLRSTHLIMHTFIHSYGIQFVKHTHTLIIVRRAGLLLSQQDFEWRWSVPLFKCFTVLEFSFILFDLCLLITFFNSIMNYVPIVTFWIFTYHKIWILSIMFCFIWSYWIIYFLACLEVSWRVVS